MAGMSMMQLGPRPWYRSLMPYFLTMQYMACKTFYMQYMTVVQVTYLSSMTPTYIICLIVYNYALRGCICSTHTKTHLQLGNMHGVMDST
jgi:hypothetical protein